MSDQRQLQYPPLIVNGKTTNTIQDKLKVFADSLEHIFSTNPVADQPFTENTEQAVNDFLTQPLTERLRPTNHSEIAWLTRHLKPRKAPGPDGIQNNPSTSPPFSF
jgi:hypothetical protein